METLYNKNNPKILNDYLKFLHKIKNYSENTVLGYCLDLLCFFNFLKEYWSMEISVKEFTVFVLYSVKEADVIAFLVYLNNNRDNTGCTRNRKLIAIRGFFKWLFNNYPHNEKRVNPTNNIKSARIVERLPKYLTLEQAKKVCKVFNSKNSKFPRKK